jgi:type I restriction enzyme R subunit
MGECVVRTPDVRREVESVLLHFDGQRYDVDAFVLMPNHVHMILTPAAGRNLATLMKGIKGVSANQCNALLARSGTFWMDESHDHIIRDAAELAAFRNYIAENPAKAGLNENEYTLQLRYVLEVEPTA